MHFEYNNYDTLYEIILPLFFMSMPTFFFYQ